MKTIQKFVSGLDNVFEPLSRDGRQIEIDADQNSDKLPMGAVDIEPGIDMATFAAVTTSTHEASTGKYIEAEPAVSNDSSIAREGVTKVTESVDSGTNESVRLRIVFPMKQFKSNGMITTDLPKSGIAEEYRRIKRPLLANIASAAAERKELVNVVMVTSCVEGEGKTFTAFNLAMSLAMERDWTVLLIDSDVAKATASSNLGLSGGQPGLTDLLMDPTLKISDVLYHTNVENLQFIPAGVKTDHATEILASDGMSKLLNQLSRQCQKRIIVFDAPPVLVTSEAIALAERVGQIVFVVGAESVTHGMVADALSQITGNAWIGLVLNKIRKKIASKYGYGYGYGQDSRGSVTEGGAGAA